MSLLFEIGLWVSGSTSDRMTRIQQQERPRAASPLRTTATNAAGGSSSSSGGGGGRGRAMSPPPSQRSSWARASRSPTSSSTNAINRARSPPPSSSSSSSSRLNSTTAITRTVTSAPVGERRSSVIVHPRVPIDVEVSGSSTSSGRRRLSSLSPQRQRHQSPPPQTSRSNGIRRPSLQQQQQQAAALITRSQSVKKLPSSSTTSRTSFSSTKRSSITMNATTIDRPSSAVARAQSPLRSTTSPAPTTNGHHRGGSRDMSPIRSQSVKKVSEKTPWGARPKVTLTSATSSNSTKKSPVVVRRTSTSSPVVPPNHSHRRSASTSATPIIDPSILGGVEDTLDLDDERIYSAASAPPATASSKGFNGNGFINTEPSLMATASSPDTSDNSNGRKVFRERGSVKRVPSSEPHIMGAVVEERDEDLTTPRAPGRLSFDATIVPSPIPSSSSTSTIPQSHSRPSPPMVTITTNALIMADTASDLQLSALSHHHHHDDRDAAADDAFARLSAVAAGLNAMITRSEKRTPTANARRQAAVTMSDKKRPSSAKPSLAHNNHNNNINGHRRVGSHSLSSTVPSRGLSPSRSTSGTMPPSRTSSVKKIPLRSTPPPPSSSQSSIRSPNTSVKKRPSTTSSPPSSSSLSSPPNVPPTSTTASPPSSSSSSSSSSTISRPNAAITTAIVSTPSSPPLSLPIIDDTVSSASSIVLPIVFGPNQIVKESAQNGSTTTNGTPNGSTSPPPSSSSSSSLPISPAAPAKALPQRHVRHRSVGGLMVTVGAHDVSSRPSGFGSPLTSGNNTPMLGSPNGPPNSGLPDRPLWGSHKIEPGAGHKRYSSGPLSQAILTKLAPKKSEASWKQGTIITQHTMSGAVAAQAAMNPAAITRAQTDAAMQAAAAEEIAAQRQRMRINTLDDDEEDSSPDSSDIDSVIDDTSSIASGSGIIENPNERDKRERGLDRLRQRWGRQFENGTAPSTTSSTNSSPLLSGTTLAQSNQSNSIPLPPSASSITAASSWHAASHSRGSSTGSTSSGFWQSPLLKEPEVVAAQFMNEAQPMPTSLQSLAASLASLSPRTLPPSSTTTTNGIAPPAGLSIMVGPPSPATDDEVTPVDTAVVQAIRRASITASASPQRSTPSLTPATNSQSSSAATAVSTSSSSAPLSTGAAAVSSTSPRYGHNQWPRPGERHVPGAMAHSLTTSQLAASTSSASSTPAAAISSSTSTPGSGGNGHARKHSRTPSSGAVDIGNGHHRRTSSGYKVRHLPPSPPTDSDSDLSDNELEEEVYSSTAVAAAAARRRSSAAANASASSAIGTTSPSSSSSPSITTRSPIATPLTPPAPSLPVSEPPPNIRLLRLREAAPRQTLVASSSSSSLHADSSPQHPRGLSPLRTEW
jgi:hypothetical protein